MDNKSLKFHRTIKVDSKIIGIEFLTPEAQTKIDNVLKPESKGLPTNFFPSIHGQEVQWEKIPQLLSHEWVFCKDDVTIIYDSITELARVQYGPISIVIPVNEYGIDLELAASYLNHNALVLTSFAETYASHTNEEKDHMVTSDLIEIFGTAEDDTVTDDGLGQDYQIVKTETPSGKTGEYDTDISYTYNSEVKSPIPAAVNAPKASYTVDGTPMVWNKSMRGFQQCLTSIIHTGNVHYLYSIFIEGEKPVVNVIVRKDGEEPVSTFFIQEGKDIKYHTADSTAKHYVPPRTDINGIVVENNEWDYAGLTDDNCIQVRYYIGNAEMARRTQYSRVLELRDLNLR